MKNPEKIPGFLFGGSNYFFLTSDAFEFLI